MIELFNTFATAFIDKPIGQTIGLFAFGISIYNFLFCKNKKFIFFSMVASLVWGIHFHSIGLISAGLINYADTIKNFLALKYQKNNKLVITFVIFYLIIGYFTFEGYISIIPTINALISTFLVFYVRGIWLNIGFMFVIGLWAIYNFYGQSVGGLTTDLSLFIIGTIGIHKLIKADNKDKETIIIEEEKEIKRDLESI